QCLEHRREVAVVVVVLQRELAGADILQERLHGVVGGGLAVVDRREVQVHGAAGQGGGEQPRVEQEGEEGPHEGLESELRIILSSFPCCTSPVAPRKATFPEPRRMFGAAAPSGGAAHEVSGRGKTLPFGERLARTAYFVRGSAGPAGAL